jgi:hypothetical protein
MCRLILTVLSVAFFVTPCAFAQQLINVLVTGDMTVSARQELNALMIPLQCWNRTWKKRIHFHDRLAF